MTEASKRHSIGFSGVLAHDLATRPGPGQHWEGDYVVNDDGTDAHAPDCRGCRVEAEVARLYEQLEAAHVELRECQASFAEVEKVATSADRDRRIFNDLAQKQKARAELAEAQLSDLRRQMEEQRAEGNWPLSTVVAERDELRERLTKLAEWYGHDLDAALGEKTRRA